MAQDRAGTPTGGEPDPGLLWRWVGRATRPYIGWILAGAGLLAIVIGWYGSAQEVYVARQVPYIVSGGLFGIALVFFGGIFLGIHDLRTVGERLSRLERQIGDLHAVLLAQTDVEATTPVSGNGAAPRFVALDGGSSYHRPGCAVVRGKDGLRDVDPAEADGLSPCKLCEPAGAEASTAS